MSAWRKWKRTVPCSWSHDPCRLVTDDEDVFFGVDIGLQVSNPAALTLFSHRVPAQADGRDGRNSMRRHSPEASETATARTQRNSSFTGDSREIPAPLSPLVGFSRPAIHNIALDGKPMAVAGVTCESCEPARDTGIVKKQAGESPAIDLGEWRNVKTQCSAVCDARPSAGTADGLARAIGMTRIPQCKTLSGHAGSNPASPTTLTTGQPEATNRGWLRGRAARDARCGNVSTAGSPVVFFPHPDETSCD